MLYEIEDSIRDRATSDILQQRRKRSSLIVQEFFECLRHELTDLTLLPSSLFSKAAARMPLSE